MQWLKTRACSDFLKVVKNVMKKFIAQKHKINVSVLNFHFAGNFGSCFKQNKNGEMLC